MLFFLILFHVNNEKLFQLISTLSDSKVMIISNCFQIYWVIFSTHNHTHSYLKIFLAFYSKKNEVKCEQKSKPIKLFSRFLLPRAKVKAKMYCVWKGSEREKVSRTKF